MSVKPISAGMQAMLDSGCITLAWALKITRADGQVFAWTSHDQDAVIGGVAYTAAPGFDVASFANASGLAVGNNELTVLDPDDSSAFTRQSIYGRLWDAAEYEIFQYDFANLANGTIAWQCGRLGVLTPKHGAFVAELRDVRQPLQADTTRRFQAACPYAFGSTALPAGLCMVNLAPITVTGTITAVTDQTTFADSARTEADDYFGYGEVTFTSGANAGVTAKVRAYAGATKTFTLDMALVPPLQVGDTYSAVPGCRKRLAEDCIAKWSNVLNFGGEPDKPTQDAAVAPPVV